MKRGPDHRIGTGVSPTNAAGKSRLGVLLRPDPQVNVVRVATNRQVKHSSRIYCMVALKRVAAARTVALPLPALCVA